MIAFLSFRLWTPCLRTMLSYFFTACLKTVFLFTILSISLFINLFTICWITVVKQSESFQLHLPGVATAKISVSIFYFASDVFPDTTLAFPHRLGTGRRRACTQRPLEAAFLEWPGVSSSQLNPSLFLKGQKIPLEIANSKIWKNTTEKKASRTRRTPLVSALTQSHREGFISFIPVTSPTKRADGTSLHSIHQEEQEETAPTDTMAVFQNFTWPQNSNPLFLMFQYWLYWS